MVIRQVNSSCYDVFGDKGWDNWTRVRSFHWGPKVVAGVFLPRPILQDVIVAINAHPNGSMENV